MRTTKVIDAQQIPEIKTFNSQQSNIDLFSKLQSSFLEKFFKYNLTDYFPDTFINLYEDLFARKAISKAQKNMTTNMFLVNEGFVVEEAMEKINRFYRNKSNSIAQQQFPYAFRYKYCSRNPVPNMIRANQLVYVEVKIKIEVQKIQEIPEKIYSIFHRYQSKVKGTKNQSAFEKLLMNYKQEYFTIFFVYFGDSNFNIFNKQKYQQLENITIMGRTFKVRIFVFYVSRQALIQCFRTINKINNLEYINDLVIQFYELKRDKQRRKRNRQPILYKNNQQENIFQKNSQTLYKVAVVVTLVGFGAIIKKAFF